jgi:hypothetical protein
MALDGNKEPFAGSEDVTGWFSPGDWSEDFKTRRS